MEQISDFIELCVGGILFCAAVWFLFAQLQRLPELAVLLPGTGFEPIHVR